MHGCQSMTTMSTSCEGEQHVIAAAQHILKVLGANKNLSDEFRRALTELDSHLSAMTIITESKRWGFAEVEEQLKCAERKVMRWESNPSLIWDSGPAEASEYMQAVNEIHRVMETLGALAMNGHGRLRELAFRAQCAQQIAMSRLEEELYHLLAQHKQSFEPQYISVSSSVHHLVYDESFVSVDDQDTSWGDNSGRECIEYAVDLIDPLVIPDIKSIANVMFASGYDGEFCEAFIRNRKEALDEHLSNLETFQKKLSIEDVLKLEWDTLSCEIKNWVRAMKIIIRVYLPSEKRFCNQILGDFGSLKYSYCFLEISRASILCLLSFGEAIAMGPYKPERLFRFLDMYELLADLHLDMEGLFSEEADSFVTIEFHGLLRRLGDSASRTFFKFGNAIALVASIQPFPRGEIHHLTRYVMNYINALTAYCDTLNLILKDQHPNPVLETDEEQEDICSSSTTTTFSPLGAHLRAITSTLESNLICKSKLYKDGSLGHIFLMNNIHYVVQKVKGSELRLFFGDEWIRKHNGKFQQHATSYERGTWSFVVSLLRDDGRTSLKERCRRFNNAFDDVYKIQTQWCIPDLHLREDLQISTSQKVIPAYRAFLGMNNKSSASDKYIKYTSDDLEKMLLDLFAGSSTSLRHSRRWP